MRSDHEIKIEIANHIDTIRESAESIKELLSNFGDFRKPATNPEDPCQILYDLAEDIRRKAYIDMGPEIREIITAHLCGVEPQPKPKVEPVPVKLGIIDINMENVIKMAGG